jgi:ligand-binding SRPBCC domain-containing protein
VGTVRRHIFIDAPAETVWDLVGDPSRLDEWFPITGCEVARDDGATDLAPNQRWITLASGLRFEERIITLDHDLRRFQYSIVNNPIVKSHLGTVDVIADGDDRCLVVYSTDLEPDVMALVIAGAAGAGLQRLAELFDGRGSSDAATIDRSTAATVTTSMQTGEH